MAVISILHIIESRLFLVIGSLGGKRSQETPNPDRKYQDGEDGYYVDCTLSVNSSPSLTIKYTQTAKNTVLRY